MKLSRLLAPTSRNNPSKVRDEAAIRLVRGGYGLYEPSSEELLLLPLGEVTLDNIFDLFDDLCRDEGGQSVDSASLPEGALSIAVRIVKQEEQLPLLLFERRGRGLDLLSIDGASAPDPDGDPILERLGEELRDRGLEPVFLEKEPGGTIRLALKGSPKARRAVEGLVCPRCGWAGTAHSPAPGRIVDYGPSQEALKEVRTPGADTIAELCRQLDLPPERTLKTMFYSLPAPDGEGRQVVVVLMRGDCKISEAKVAAFFGVDEVRFATAVELHETMGSLGGYLGPVGLPEGVTVIADENVQGLADVAVGANRADHHRTGAAWGRDFRAVVTDLIALEKGKPCPACGASLEEATWRVIAERTPLGTLPAGMDLSYRDSDRKPRRPRLATTRLDAEALLMAFFDGDTLPLDIAPFQVLVTPWGERESPSAEAAESLHDELSEAGFAVLLDDRFAKAPLREADFDGLSLPVRIALHDEADSVRATLHIDGETADLPLDDAAHFLFHALGGSCSCCDS